jgi:hypothetical protein
MQPGYPSWQMVALTIIRLFVWVLPRETLLQSSGLERAAGRKSNGSPLSCGWGASSGKSGGGLWTVAFRTATRSLAPPVSLPRDGDDETLSGASSSRIPGTALPGSECRVSPRETRRVRPMPPGTRGMATTLFVPRPPCGRSGASTKHLPSPTAPTNGWTGCRMREHQKPGARDSAGVGRDVDGRVVGGASLRSPKPQLAPVWLTRCLSSSFKSNPRGKLRLSGDPRCVKCASVNFCTLAADDPD